MQTTNNAIDLQLIKNECESRIDSFFSQFGIATIARNSSIKKARGYSALTILLNIFVLPFIGKNIYRSIVINPKSDVGKDAIYEFMRSSNFGWRRFLLKLAFGVHEFIDGLTSKDRESVLILDDSTIERPRSKKVELLAKVHDHTTGRFLKGFKLLTLAWSDGSTLLPLDFVLRSSANKKQRYQEVSKDLDKRSCGARRRQEAVTKSTELIEPMIERALKAGIKAKFLLMDSWFAMPALISKVCKHIPVICMVKRTAKVHYIFEGRAMDVTQIYSQIRKRRGRAKILANAQVEFKDGLKAKLVFVRNKHKRDWLALLTTDLILADEDVVRIYGKRWDIEVFFRTAKQHLELEKGCQGRDYDALIAHTTIVMTRYIFLSIEKRRTEDPRTLGLLFHRCCEEAEDCTLVKALCQILGITLENLKKLGDNQSQAERILLEAFQEGMRSLGHNFNYIFNEQRLLAANG
ncbi:MAG: transposase [Desulfomicrobium sp.]